MPIGECDIQLRYCYENLQDSGEVLSEYREILDDPYWRCETGMQEFTMNGEVWISGGDCQLIQLPEPDYLTALSVGWLLLMAFAIMKLGPR